MSNILEKEFKRLDSLTEEDRKIIRENCLKIEARAKSRLERMAKNTILEGLYNQNDWVSSIKLCIERFAICFKNLADFPNDLFESNNQEKFIRDIKDKINNTLTSFIKLSHFYAMELELQKLKPMSMKARTNLEKEINSFWDRNISQELSNTKAKYKQIKTKAIMMNVWDELSEFHIFFDVIEKITIPEMRRNLANGELLLGKEVDELDDELF